MQVQLQGNTGLAALWKSKRCRILWHATGWRSVWLALNTPLQIRGWKTAVWCDLGVLAFTFSTCNNVSACDRPASSLEWSPNIEIHIDNTDRQCWSSGSLNSVRGTKAKDTITKYRIRRGREYSSGLLGSHADAWESLVCMEKGCRLQLSVPWFCEV